MERTLETERDGLKCVNYANILVAQLLVLIHAYYDQTSYTRFFSAMLSCDAMFSNFVYDNWKRLQKACRMAEELQMTERQFTELFRDTFGDTPGAWLRQRKSGSIYQDLCSSVLTLKDIASDYGFSMPNFVRYCRDNYGRSPGAIRNRIRIEEPYKPMYTER